MIKKLTTFLAGLLIVGSSVFGASLADGWSTPDAATQPVSFAYELLIQEDNVIFDSVIDENDNVHIVFVEEFLDDNYQYERIRYHRYSLDGTLLYNGYVGTTNNNSYWNYPQLTIDDDGQVYLVANVWNDTSEETEVHFWYLNTSGVFTSYTGGSDWTYYKHAGHDRATWMDADVKDGVIHVVLGSWSGGDGEDELEKIRYGQFDTNTGYTYGANHGMVPLNHEDFWNGDDVEGVCPEMAISDYGIHVVFVGNSNPGNPTLSQYYDLDEVLPSEVPISTVYFVDIPFVSGTSLGDLGNLEGTILAYEGLGTRRYGPPTLKESNGVLYTTFPHDLAPPFAVKFSYRDAEDLGLSTWHTPTFLTEGLDYQYNWSPDFYDFDDLGVMHLVYNWGINSNDQFQMIHTVYRPGRGAAMAAGPTIRYSADDDEFQHNIHVQAVDDIIWAIYPLNLGYGNTYFQFRSFDHDAIVGSKPLNITFEGFNNYGHPEIDWDVVQADYSYYLVAGWQVRATYDFDDPSIPDVELFYNWAYPPHHYFTDGYVSEGTREGKMYYYIKSWDIYGNYSLEGRSPAVVGIISSKLGKSGEVVELPTEFNIGNAYPNPFNPQAAVPYAVPENSNVSIVVYDVLGNVVYNKSEAQAPGYYEFILDGSSLSSGIYIVSMRVGDISSTQRVSLLK